MKGTAPLQRAHCSLCNRRGNFSLCLMRINWIQHWWKISTVRSNVILSPLFLKIFLVRFSTALLSKTWTLLYTFRPFYAPFNNRYNRLRIPFPSVLPFLTTWRRYHQSHTHVTSATTASLLSSTPPFPPFKKSLLYVKWVSFLPPSRPSLFNKPVTLMLRETFSVLLTPSLLPFP